MKRKAFAEKFHHWTAGQWKRVVFSDEKMWRVRPGGKIRCWKPKNASKFEAKYSLPSVAKSQGVMIWAAINGKGKVIIRRCPPKVNSAAYQDILATAMKFIRSRFVRNCLVCTSGTVWYVLPHRARRVKFQQDGAPVHQSKSTKAFLTNNRVVQLNDGMWPPNSPDMNPIEHVWPIVGRMLSGKIFASADDLWEALKVAFRQIDPVQIVHLYNSMPRRLQALKAAKGGLTRY